MPISGVLRLLDKLVRRSLTSRLKLPHDAVNALFHSEVREDGLGIPSFKLTPGCQTQLSAPWLPTRAPSRTSEDAVQTRRPRWAIPSFTA